MAQAWARWQLQLWVALFLQAAFRALVQPGSSVPGIGETGELPPGSSAPFHNGSPLFLLTIPGVMSWARCLAGGVLYFQEACFPEWRKPLRVWW